jgi:hypothetical protein
MTKIRVKRSVTAVVTDVVREGNPVVGYGFASVGRFAQGGLIRERFAPRLLDTADGALADDEGTNLDPFRAWARMMAGEKPGGHVRATRHSWSTGIWRRCQNQRTPPTPRPNACVYGSMPRLRDGRAAGEVIVAKGRGPIPGGDEVGAIQELRPREKCCRKISAIQDGLEEVGAGEIGPG